MQTGNIDTNVLHDHTYYGNGCHVYSWSYTACSLRTIKTFDNEDQYIGVLFNSNSSSSGSSVSITTADTNAPDSFCPLGWQIPYSGTGGDYYDKSNSWKNLVDLYDFGYSQTGSEKIRSYPFSFIQPGEYDYGQGGIAYTEIAGDYWINTVSTTDYRSYRFTIYGDRSEPRNTAYFSHGYPVRCDFDISNLESFPWHPRSLISIMAFHFLKAHFPSVKIVSNRMPEKSYFL